MEEGRSSGSPRMSHQKKLGYGKTAQWWSRGPGSLTSIHSPPPPQHPKKYLTLEPINSLPPEQRLALSQRAIFDTTCKKNHQFHTKSTFYPKRQLALSTRERFDSVPSIYDTISLPQDSNRIWRANILTCPHGLHTLRVCHGHITPVWLSSSLRLLIWVLR